VRDGRGKVRGFAEVGFGSLKNAARESAGEQDALPF
jgi:hypothetical protein